MKAIILSLLTFTAIQAHSQLNYNIAIGIRGGETSGLTLKKSLGSSSALEFIVGAWRYSYSITGLYEKIQPVFKTSGFNMHYGLGAHVAVQNRYYDRYYYNNRNYAVSYYHDGGIGLGIDGILGLEYKFNKAPIAISADIKPFIETNTNGGFWTALDPGIGIKIAF